MTASLLAQRLGRLAPLDLPRQTRIGTRVAWITVVDDQTRSIEESATVYDRGIGAA
jgi:hypothetical protein